MAAAGAVAVEPATFVLVSELELHKAVRLQYPISLLTLVPRPEEGTLAEHEKVGVQLSDVIRLLLRSTDLIERPISSAKLRVLLLGALPEDLPAIVSRLETEVTNHRVMTDRGARRVSLQVGVASFPMTAATLEELLARSDVEVSEPTADA
jgi:hypothetical protein